MLLMIRFFRVCAVSAAALLGACEFERAPEMAAENCAPMGDYATSSAQMFNPKINDEAQVCMGQEAQCIVVPKIGHEDEVVDTIVAMKGRRFECRPTPESMKTMYVCSMIQNPNNGAWTNTADLRCGAPTTNPFRRE